MEQKTQNQLKASDLRIGNWIADRGGKEWQIDHWESANKVSAKIPTMVFDSVIEMQGHPLTEDVDCLKPIPLTEEWLLKFGFDVRDRSVSLGISGELKRYATKTVVDMGEYSKTKFTLWYSKRYGWTLAPNIRQPELSHFINSVHELQNLYHALTGEELTYGK